MKKVLIWIVVLSIAYFIIGYLLVIVECFDKDSYLTLSAIIGGIASVSGLLALTTNRFEKDDVERVGIEYFKKVVESAEELKKKEVELISKEEALTAKEKEIKDLDIKKNEMEYLVRKASMSLFLKDQIERTDSRIIEISEENKELNRLIIQRRKIVKQLSEIEGEIEGNSNIELINDIIESTKLGLVEKAKRKKPETFIEFVSAVVEELTKILVIRF